MKPPSPGRPWYREPWPWILISIPAVSVVLGIVMIFLAVTTHDGLVVDDYYKQGLAINQVLDRENRAREMGVRAQLAFNADRSRVRLLLRGVASEGEVHLRLVHPTRAGEDQALLLAPAGGGVWEAAVKPLAAGRWRVVLEDEQAGWRLTGVWHTDEAVLALGQER